MSRMPIGFVLKEWKEIYADGREIENRNKSNMPMKRL
jgi:hypothetical protein